MKCVAQMPQPVAAPASRSHADVTRAARGAGAVEQAYSDEARQQADKACQNHEPPVVLAREAIENTRNIELPIFRFSRKT